MFLNGRGDFFSQRDICMLVCMVVVEESCRERWTKILTCRRRHHYPVGGLF